MAPPRTGAPPPHPRLTRVSRWDSIYATSPWDAFVVAFLGYTCFVLPFFLVVLALLLFFPAWLALECGWYAHRAALRRRHEAFTDPPPFEYRKEHMRRFLRLKEDVVPCFIAFTRAWFRDAPAALVKRENARDFFRYAFYGVYMKRASDAEEAELDAWLDDVEKHWDITLPPGRTEGLTFMAHMRDGLRTTHQPLFTVFYSHAAGTLGGVILRLWGFRHHGCGDTGVTYWIRDKSSSGRKKKKKKTTTTTTTTTTKRGTGGGRRSASGGVDVDDAPDADDARCERCGGDPLGRRCFAGCRDRADGSPTPVVMLHGLGIGLSPYLWTVASILRATPTRPVVLVCLPEISLRHIVTVRTPDAFVNAIESACVRHDLRRPCLMGHSFGTFVVARACQRSVVASTMLVDPVACCLMLTRVIHSVLFAIEDVWRELTGRESAGLARVSEAAREASGVRSAKPPRVTWRRRVELVASLAALCVRDVVIVRELSCAVALSRTFWWWQVVLHAEDTPRDSLCVLQSHDSILDAGAVAKHVLNRDASDVLWLDGFRHGELLGPTGFVARTRMAEFLKRLD